MRFFRRCIDPGCVTASTPGSSARQVFGAQAGRSLNGLRNRTGEWPLPLLLDEVMAELDAKRRAYFAPRRVNGANQSIG